MHLSLVTPPPVLVTVEEAKAHLRVLTTDEDSLVEALVAAATAHLDGRYGVLGRALATQTWDLRLDGFPCGAIELPLPPLQSVTSVKYLDATGAEVTLAGTDYAVDTGHLQGRIRPAYGLTWPVPRDEPGAVRIRFTAGYGAAHQVPPPLKHAVLLLVGQWFLNREAAGDAKGPNAYAVEALTAPYRVWSP